MSKVFCVILAVLVIAASVVLAMPHRIRGGAGDLAFIECQDHACKVGCRTLHKIPTDTCTTLPFRHNESVKALCSAAPLTGLCYYMSLFKENNATDGNYCTNANIDFVNYEQCDVCHESFRSKGVYHITTGCNSSTTMVLKHGCNAGCTTCNETHQVTEKKCIVPKGFPVAVEFSVPARCQKSIKSFQYNNSECVTSASTITQTEFSNVCYSYGFRSHMYVCS